MANRLLPHHLDITPAFRARVYGDLLRVPKGSRFLDRPSDEVPGVTVIIGYCIAGISGGCVGAMLASAAFLAFQWVAL